MSHQKRPNFVFLIDPKTLVLVGCPQMTLRCATILVFTLGLISQYILNFVPMFLQIVKLDCQSFTMTPWSPGSVKDFYVYSSSEDLDFAQKLVRCDQILAKVWLPQPNEKRRVESNSIRILKIIAITRVELPCFISSDSESKHCLESGSSVC